MPREGGGQEARRPGVGVLRWKAAVHRKGRRIKEAPGN